MASPLVGFFRERGETEQEAFRPAGFGEATSRRSLVASSTSPRMLLVVAR
ncbi:hypothetical protein KY285_010412 [Solanum tuberosum]|nr:hypothetical protein KY289_010961 [Solanum tuberosum]KAH0734705.1 hypothetical protein KY285_010412 [Solanum tuberosum]